MTAPAKTSTTYTDQFASMSDRRQREEAYSLALKHGPKNARPDNVSSMAAGVTAGLLELPQPNTNARQRNGWMIGRAIREGVLQP